MEQNTKNSFQTELEALFVNNAELDNITAHFNRFNPIRVMRMEGMEIRHSAILAWLLDPIENHGFDDKFLKAFLSQALMGDDNSRLTALDVSQADLRDAEVQREKRNMDIFVSSPLHGWAFIIENKFHTKQHDGQLDTYLKRAEQDASDSNKNFVVQGVFLTLDEEKPESDAYVSLRYTDICLILNSLMTAYENKMASDVKHFLNHYLEIIRDITDMSENQKEMETLARKLYRKHKKAMDFIMEHGVSTDFTIAAESVFGDNLEYGDFSTIGELEVMYSWNNQRLYSFLPRKWLDALGGEDKKPWPGCENWWAEYPIICWLQLNTKDDGIGGTLFLYAEVGPLSDPESRKNIIEQIKACTNEKNKDLIKFRADATKTTAKYSKFLNRNSVPINDISDAAAIAQGMQKLIKKFTPVIGSLDSAIKAFSKDKDSKIV